MKTAPTAKNWERALETSAAPQNAEQLIKWSREANSHPENGYLMRQIEGLSQVLARISRNEKA